MTVLGGGGRFIVSEVPLYGDPATDYFP